MLKKKQAKTSDGQSTDEESQTSRDTVMMILDYDGKEMKRQNTNPYEVYANIGHS